MSIAKAFRRGLRKIRQIAVSELVFTDKVRYTLAMAIGSLRGISGEGHQEYRIQGGMVVCLRGNSTDGKVFEEIFIEKVYTPHARTVKNTSPILLVDLGANVGLSVIALARDLRPLAIVAVEPDPDNYTTLQANLQRSGLAERCTAIRAFAGLERGFAELIDSGNGSWGMRMGASTETGVPVLPMEEILGTVERVASGAARDGERSGNASLQARRGTTTVLKCDIEGAERELFRHLHRWEDGVDYVILELHTEFLSADEFHACLAGSRYHWRFHGTIPPHALLAVIGLERLAPKAEAHIRAATGS